MPDVPRHPDLDSTLGMLRDPYRFIGRWCRHFETDLFRTRLLLEETICLTGRDAAALFYDPERFTRQGAAPEPVRATLFGKGGVQGLDGEVHRHRKAMFMSLMTPGRVAALAEEVRREWQSSCEQWEKKDRVLLYDELKVLLTKGVCRWAGVPLEASEVNRRTRGLSILYDDAGALPIRHLSARRARALSERWASKLIRQVRCRRLTPAPETALYGVAWHRDPAGVLLDARVAAVELLNVPRPVVAIAVYIVFLARALEVHGRDDNTLLSRGDNYRDFYIEEVRRHYPFFPFVAARTKDHFRWNGFHFPKGVRVLLDLYGTNHDPQVWEVPDEFRPQRFTDRKRDQYAFVPQGGDDPDKSHRCAGERVTVELMRVAMECLLRGMRYSVPRQDLAIDFSRLPALPRDHFLIEKVHSIQP